MGCLISSRAGTLLDSIHFVAYFIVAWRMFIGCLPPRMPSTGALRHGRATRVGVLLGALPHGIRSSRVEELPSQQLYLAQPTNRNKRMTDAQRYLDTVRDET
jgi:hypothetical protein